MSDWQKPYVVHVVKCFEFFFACFYLLNNLDVYDVKITALYCPTVNIVFWFWFFINVKNKCVTIFNIDYCLNCLNIIFYDVFFLV